MIDQSEVNAVVHALQDIPVRDDLVVCVVLLDVSDGTLVATAPMAVNMPIVLKMAADRYNERAPDASGLVRPGPPRN